MTVFRRVLITGASRGIGRALALACAGPDAVLHLSGLDAADLEETARQARALGAAAHPRVLDVRDAPGMAAWIAGAGPLDLAVANAGVSPGTGGGLESAEQARDVFEVNLHGMLNTVQPALARMAAQRPDAEGVRGRIAVLASMAIYVPAPGAPAYAASKAAADLWARATGVVARERGVTITSCCPGYVRGFMTDRNRFPMPGLMTPERAAAAILAATRRGRSRASFPFWMGFGARLAGMLPAELLSRLLDRFPGGVAAPYRLGPG